MRLATICICIAMPRVVTGSKLCIFHVRSALLCILESGDEIFDELGLDRSRDEKQTFQKTKRDEKQAKVPIAPVCMVLHVWLNDY
jgi:hypothetical protein